MQGCKGIKSAFFREDNEMNAIFAQENSVNLQLDIALFSLACYNKGKKNSGGHYVP